MTSLDYKYYYDLESKLIAIKRIVEGNTLRIDFLYDDNKSLIGFIYQGNSYYYIKDQLNTINKIIDSNGIIKVEYYYDSFGNIIDIIDNTSGVLSSINPFRYKCYIYDTETGLYYLNSRYYNPIWRRFLTPDSVDYLDPSIANGLNLYVYCNNNPVMYSDGSGHMPEWAQWLLGGAIVVGALAATFATAGIAAPLITGAGSAWAAIGIGAAAGAVSGAISGFGISVGTQAIASGFENIDWCDAGKSTLSGAISGAIAGGVFGGIKHVASAKKIGSAISGINKANEGIKNALNPLNSITKMAKMPFSGNNISHIIGQVAVNYNSAYTNLVIASLDQVVATSVMNGIYAGAQFCLKQGVGALLDLVW